MNYLYFGHHKAATVWICFVTSRIMESAGLRWKMVAHPLDFDYKLSHYIERERPDFLCYLNADSKLIDLKEEFRGFHVVRDPRDMLISAYFSHRYSHPLSVWPELAAHRAALNKCDIEKGLFCEMDFCDRLPTRGVDLRLFDAMLDWNYHDPRIMEVKFEEITARPVETFEKIFDHLGLLGSAVNMRTIEESLNRTSFKEMTGGRPVGVEDKMHHCRKGTAGQWKEHFTEEHVIEVKRRYTPLLLKLGYENSANWGK